MTDPTQFEFYFVYGSKEGNLLNRLCHLCFSAVLEHKEEFYYENVAHAFIDAIWKQIIISSRLSLQQNCFCSPSYDLSYFHRVRQFDIRKMVNYIPTFLPLAEKKTGSSTQSYICNVYIKNCIFNVQLSSSCFQKEPYFNHFNYYNHHSTRSVSKEKLSDKFFHHLRLSPNSKEVKAKKAFSQGFQLSRLEISPKFSTFFASLVYYNDIVLLKKPSYSQILLKSNFFLSHHKVLSPNLSWDLLFTSRPNIQRFYYQLPLYKFEQVSPFEPKKLFLAVRDHLVLILKTNSCDTRMENKPIKEGNSLLSDDNPFVLAMEDLVSLQLGMLPNDFERKTKRSQEFFLESNDSGFTCDFEPMYYSISKYTLVQAKRVIVNFISQENRIFALLNRFALSFQSQFQILFFPELYPFGFSDKVALMQVSSTCEVLILDESSLLQLHCIPSPIIAVQQLIILIVLPDRIDLEFYSSFITLTSAFSKLPGRFYSFCTDHSFNLSLKLILNTVHYNNDESDFQENVLFFEQNELESVSFKSFIHLVSKATTKNL